MFESRATIAQRMAATHPTWSYDVESAPGIAVCDMLPTLSGLLHDERPTVVVFEAHGNSYTPCMADRNGVLLAPGTPAWAAQYKADLTTAFTAVSATGAKIVYISALEVSSPLWEPTRIMLADAVAAAAAPFANVTISGGARTAFGGNMYRRTLPCLTGALLETPAMGCTARRIVVHAPDGVHFCPTGYVTLDDFQAGCPLYSSGAVRWARAVVAAAAKG